MLALVPAAPARAQAGPDVDVRFDGISAWTSPDRPFRLILTMTNRSALPIEDVSVRISVSRRVITRGELRSALNGERGGLVAVTTEDLGPALEPGERRQVTVDRSLPELSTSFRLGQGRSGVYPVEVELTDRRGTLGRWFTAAVFLIVPPPARLNVAWVLPLHDPPAFDAEGRYDREEIAAALGTRGLGETIHALAASRVPVTLAPSGYLLDALSSVATGGTVVAGAVPEGEATGGPPATPPADPVSQGARSALGDLRSAALGTPQLAMLPYSRADLTALDDAGLGSDISRQIAETKATGERVLGLTPPDDLLAGPLRVGREIAPTLSSIGVRRLVLAPDDLPRLDDPTAPGLGFGATRPALVEGHKGVRFQALIADPDIRARLARPDEDPVLKAQAIIAETASSFLEVPSLASERLIVIAGDTMPNSTTVRRLPDALGRAPWVQLQSASQAFDRFPPEGEPVPLPSGRVRPTAALTDAARARELVDRLRDVVVEPAPGIAMLDRLVLAAESADWSRRPDVGRRIAGIALDRATDVIGRIRTAERQVTLTSRTGGLPVTLINETGLRIRVRVRLEAVKVAFPEGSVRTVTLDGRVRTLEFAASARATGSFSVRVVLETPTLRRSLGSGEIVVRSTAVSAVTLIATGGGTLVLLLGWFRRGRRRRAVARGPAPTSPA